jgi:hypothetical protein
MMVVMMVFVMPLMHGGHKDHGDSSDHGKNEQKHEHAGMGPQHMSHEHGAPEKGVATSETVETKGSGTIDK